MRALRILLIIALVLGGLFVAADRLALNLAESEVADKIKSSQGLAGTPQVSIKGFPFLTQIVGQELDEVEIGLDGMTASADGRAIRVTEMSAVLRDVRIENNFSAATAASASGSASISYEDLSKAADDGIGISYGGADKNGKPQVKVTARLQLPTGQSIERSVLSTVAIADGDKIRLRAQEIPGSEIPGLEDVVRGKIDMERQISGLPQGLELDTAKATKNGIDVSVKGENVTLAG